MSGNNYSRWAEIYDDIYTWKNYEKEVKALRALIGERRPEAKRLLDVACGTGLHLAHLKEWFEVEGIDSEEAMLRAARRRLPGTPFHHEDMRNFSLKGKFDVVTCLFSAIAHLTSREDVDSAIRNMANHLDEDGLLIVEPFITRDKWIPNNVSADWVDKPELKIARIGTSELKEETADLHMEFLVGRPGIVEHFTIDEEMNLFEQDFYLETIQSNGLAASFEEDGLMGRGLYFGLKKS